MYKKAWVAIKYICLIAVIVTITLHGIIGIHNDIKDNPLQSIPKVNPETQYLIREVYASYDDEGIVIDEYGYLWGWDTSLMGDKTFVKLWISDSGTPNDVTDDVIVDYSGW